MKTLVFSLALFTSALAPASSKPYFVSSCEAVATSSDPQNPTHGMTVSTSEYSLVLGHNNAVKLNIGKYVLSMSTEWMLDKKTGGFTPHIYMFLFDGSLNPSTGKVNSIILAGADLENRPLGLPLTAVGMDFLEFEIEGHLYSRVDYSCSVTRVR